MTQNYRLCMLFKSDWLKSQLEAHAELLMSRALLKVQGHAVMGFSTAPAAHLNLPSLGDTPMALSLLLQMAPKVCV
jgi:hypothetical protein